MEDKTEKYPEFRKNESDGDTGGSKQTITSAVAPRKRSNQIARELSDIVTYVQVISILM